MFDGKQCTPISISAENCVWNNKHRAIGLQVCSLLYASFVVRNVSFQSIVYILISEISASHDV
jgi:hypothetical protein